MPGENYQVGETIKFSFSGNSYQIIKVDREQRRATFARLDDLEDQKTESFGDLDEHVTITESAN